VVRWGWKTAAIVAAVAVVAAVVVLWRDTSPEPAGSSSRPEDRARTAPSASAESPARPAHEPSRWAAPATSSPVARANATPVEAIDPCSPVTDVEVPKGFEAASVDGITIAWQRDAPGPYDAPLRPTVLARAVMGVLEDAAEATGTAARPHLLVVVYPSEQAMRADGAPEWASGFYDGAVHVARDPASELGVRLSTLRHEVMHAQLHAGVGCIPVWLNEGIASWYASDLSLGALLALLRDRDLLDLSVLEARTFETLGTADALRAYWQSVVMLAYAIDHGDGASLASVVHRIGSLGADEPMRLAAWRRWFSGVDQSAVLDAFERRVFGSTANAADLIRGPLCCWGVRDFAQLGCRAPAGPAGERATWRDRSRVPEAFCRVTW
jgi:hypothetical protein